MPVLAKKWFQQTSEINCDYVKRLETASFGFPVAQTLAKLGWDANSLTAGVGLELSSDNRHVKRGQFFLRGQLTREPISLQANYLWREADVAVKMHVTIPDGSAFQFLSGTLSSDLIAAEDFRHYFTRGEDVIPPTDWNRLHIGETTLRAICHLDKGSNGNTGPAAKTTVLIFPKSREEMSEVSDGTQSAAWPGIRILEATCPFSPVNPLWKDPICPIFVIGAQLSEAPNAPPLQEIRHHIAAIMRSAKRATACTTGRSLRTQWEKARTDVEALEQDPHITWPEAARPPADQGKNQT